MKLNRLFHYSVDDVVNTLKWIYETRPVSIFDHPMLSTIKKWHELYGLDCSLYLYEICEEFSIDMLQDEYWQEFGRNASWLKLAWHRYASGQITDAETEDRASFYRVFQLVEKKAGRQSCARIVRLHKWQCSKLLKEALLEKGVHTLLTADTTQTNSYGIPQEIMNLLEEYGDAYYEGMRYMRTDYRFDFIEDEKDLENLFERVLYYFVKYPQRRYVVFGHEWKFKQSVPYMEEFWKRMSDIDMTAYLSAAALQGDEMYFVCSNDCNLYRMNMLAPNVETVIRLPFTNYYRTPFESMVWHGEDLWMIPWDADCFYIFDMSENRGRKLIFDGWDGLNWGNKKFRAHIVRGNLLWLMPDKFPAIFRVDMDSLEVTKYDDFPRKVKFDVEKKPFTSMCESEGILYLFSNGCSESLKLDIANGKFHIWDVCPRDCIGVVEKSNVCYIQVYGGKDFIVQDLLKKEKKQIIHVNTMDFSGFYSFWDVTAVDEYVIVLPNRNSFILLYSFQERKMYEIDVSRYRHNFLKDTKGFAVLRILKYGRKLICVPYSGDTLLKIDLDSLECEPFRISVPLHGRGNTITYEVDSGNYRSLYTLFQWELQGCLMQNNNKARTAESEIGMIGKHIFENLVKGA